MGTCRKALEALAVAIGDEKETTPEQYKCWFVNQKIMSKQERVRLARRAFIVLTHPSHHAKNKAGSIEWGLEDATAVLRITASLLQICPGK